MKTWLAAAAWTAWAASPAERVDAIFARYAESGSPGCAVGVARDGKTLVAKGYGLASLDHGIAIGPKSRFYMASVSKQFTSMAALLAQREGKLRLDDPLSKYFPGMPAYAARIPLRRMLDHTAGLRDYLTLWGLKGWSNESVLAEGPTLSLISRQKALDFEPGSDYSYSNTGYFLMSLIIERVTGQRLDAYLRERLFSPLGMRATRFQHDHSEPVPDRAQGYSRVGNGAWRTAAIGFDIVGSGGLYSNIEDMLVWARNFEEPKAGGEVLEALQTPGKLSDGRETPRGYALGLERARNGGLTLISHAGGAVGYRTFFLRVPEKKLSVVTLCNAGDADSRSLALRVAREFAPEVKIDEERAAASKPAKALAADERRALAGVYWSEELETVWRLAERGGRGGRSVAGCAGRADGGRRDDRGSRGRVHGVGGAGSGDWVRAAMKSLEGFNPSIDRHDPRSVDRLFRLLFPEPRGARAAAEHLAASIRTADGVEAESWSVTMHADCVRLNVGQVEALTLSATGARFLYHAPLPIELWNQFEVLEEDEPIYPSVPVPSGACLVPPNDLQSVPIALREAHDAYIRAAASLKRSPFQRSFSPAVVEYLQSTLGQPMPSRSTPGIGTVVPLADELNPTETFTEGAKYQVAVNAYERDPLARQQCIRKHGLRCVVCGFSFEEVYGQVAQGFIHVHHLRPLSEIGEEYRVDPERDLVPVCPNCHAVIHRRTPPYSIEEVKAELESRRRGQR